MKKQIISILGISVLFSGCAMPYNIEPYYNNTHNVVTIDTLKFKNARESKLFNPYVGGYIGTWTLNDKAYGIQNNNQCKNILYKTMKAGHRAYISSNTDDSMRSAYKKGYITNPEVTKINNLKFYKFNIKIKKKEFYSIGTDTKNNHGYDSVTFVKVDKSCFYTLKNHFIQKANKDKVIIENYNLIK